jgi:hypothetical protein
LSNLHLVFLFAPLFIIEFYYSQVFELELFILTVLIIFVAVLLIVGVEVVLFLGK